MSASETIPSAIVSDSKKESITAAHTKPSEVSVEGSVPPMKRHAKKHTASQAKKGPAGGPLPEAGEAMSFAVQDKGRHVVSDRNTMTTPSAPEPTAVVKVEEDSDTPNPVINRSEAPAILDAQIAPPELQTPVMLPIDVAIDSPPFADLLAIDIDTYNSIHSDMAVNGWDLTHPAHVWVKDDGVMVLVDGYTRKKAAKELGIHFIPVFLHYFADESEALEFEIKVQINRRNLSGGELLRLVEVCDQKSTPGAGQDRENGQFAPKASGDAIGKSAARTAKRLGTSTTKVEQARRLLKFPHLRLAVDVGELTINRAMEKLRMEEKEAEGPDENDGDLQTTELPEDKGAGDATDGPKDAGPVGTATRKTTKRGTALAEPDYSPFDIADDSSLSSVFWSPVAVEPKERKSSSNQQRKYALDEAKLDIDLKAKVFKNPGKWFKSQWIWVSPEVDLFDINLSEIQLGKILAATEAAKFLNFLFVTSTPDALNTVIWHQNTFAGVALSAQKDVDATEAAFATLNAPRKWLLIEQLTFELKFAGLKDIAWIVVRKPKAIAKAGHQPFAMKSLLRQAWAADCPVYFEEGALYRPVEFPKPLPAAVSPATYEPTDGDPNAAANKKDEADE